MSTSAAVQPTDVLLAASRRLLAAVDELAEDVAAEIEAQEPVYPRIITHHDLVTANRANLVATLRSLADVAEPSLAAAQATGRRRAEQGVPLATVLRAYRIGTKVVWSRIVRIAEEDPGSTHTFLAAAATIWELHDDFCQALAAAYQETVTERVRVHEQARDAILHALLLGELDAGARVWDCAQVLRLPSTGTFVVVVATGGGVEETLPRVEPTLAGHGVRSAWRMELDAQVGIVAATETFPVDRLAALLAELTTGRVGVSESFTALEDARAALRQARMAGAAATPGGREVIRFEQEPVSVLLAAEPVLSCLVTRSVLGPVLDLPERERAVLLTTLRAWFTADGSTAGTARLLHCHRNTVLYRLGKLAELTGLELGTPSAAARLYLALEAHRLTAP